MTRRHSRYWGSEHPDPQHGPLTNILFRNLKPGDTVTVRRADGGQATGRAEMAFADQWRVRTGPLFSYPLTAANLISITRRLS